MDHRITSRARQLREAQTTAEAVLWQHLRSRQLNGRKWRRQEPIDRYIVDFLCPELRLIVEVDGDVHIFQEEEDHIRQTYLENQGFRVVRFSNEDILKNIESVLSKLYEISSK